MTTRGRKHAGSRNGDTHDHTSREWAFSREIQLKCPAGHVLGTARQDTAQTSLSPASRDSDNPNPAPSIKFDGPPDDPTRNYRWSCSTCDRSARARDARSRAGGYRRSETVTNASDLYALLAAMRQHGPKFVRVRIDDLARMTDLVTSGEQLRRVQEFSNNPTRHPASSAAHAGVASISVDPRELLDPPTTG